MATPAHTPYGRGYDDALYFYHHAQNYYDAGVELEATGEVNACLNRFADLSVANATRRGGYGPELAELRARARASGDDELAYVEDVFRKRALRAIAAHDTTSARAPPLFLFYSFHLLHTPLQVPQRYVRAADARVAAAGGAPFDSQGRRLYAAMTLFLDEVVGDLVAALRARGMWDDTLLVFLSDNGGPVYYPGAASNYPLRGGKYSDFDGGVRTAAFLAGGAVPPAKRGTAFDGVVSIADWMATLCELAGCADAAADARAARANAWLAPRGLPLLAPIDSVPQWRHILDGTNGRAGPLQLSERAVLRWPHKLIVGAQPYAVWTGQLYPNCSTRASLLSWQGPMFTDVKVFGQNVFFGGGSPAEHARLTWAHDCGAAPGCLFDLADDPSERVDLARKDAAHAALAAELRAALDALNEGRFDPDRGGDSVRACEAALAHGGTYGPFVDAEGWYTAPATAPEDQPWHARLYLRALRALESQKKRVAEVYQSLLPKVGPFIARKFDACDPPPTATGIVDGAFNLDQVVIPLIIAFAFWKEVLVAGVGIAWAGRWLWRRWKQQEQQGESITRRRRQSDRRTRGVKKEKKKKKKRA